MKHKEFRAKLEEFEQSLRLQFIDELKDTEITFDNMGEYTLYDKNNIIRDIIVSKLTSWKVGDIFEITQTAKSDRQDTTVTETWKIKEITISYDGKYNLTYWCEEPLWNEKLKFWYQIKTDHFHSLEDIDIIDKWGVKRTTKIRKINEPQKFS